MLVNSGLAQVRNAVEHTQVRNALQQQSEYLHFLRDNPDQEPGVWQSITESVQHANGTPVNAAAASCNYINQDLSITPTTGKTPFYLMLNASNKLVWTDITTMIEPPVVAEPGKGLWIEGVMSPSINGTPSFIDFYIQACWTGLGSLGLQQMGTVTRLYLL